VPHHDDVLAAALCCRALRTQQFLEFTAADLAAREAKQRAMWAAFEASRRGKVVSKAELDEFYARLQVRATSTCRIVRFCCCACCKASDAVAARSIVNNGERDTLRARLQMHVRAVRLPTLLIDKQPALRTCLRQASFSIHVVMQLQPCRVGIGTCSLVFFGLLKGATTTTRST
jgi:hypothetical protein